MSWVDELASLFHAVIGHEGTTTGAGAAGGDSIIDAGLIGYGANSYVGFTVEIYPNDTTRVDAHVATAFNNVTGEVTVDAAFKGGQVPASVRYKINVPSPTIAAILADLAVPGADALTNILERDAIGSKADTQSMTVNNTTSLMRYLKGLVTNWTAARAAILDKILTTQHETEWVVGSTIEQVAAAAATNLTAASVTPTFPTGSTRVRAILVASLHAANQSAATHHIAIKVQGQKAAGGYTDLVDLTAQDGLGMVNVDGATDGISLAIDVTAKVDTSAVQYDFRFVVTSDNAGAVNYTQNFALILVYTP